ncbi:MAG: hypothetical protein J6J13_01130 [Clostridia bacterium]|nr:hypothetical protein [Clostridia bacterium]
MALLLFDLVGYFTYFLIMILCLTIAIIIAKKHNPWLLFLAGAILQLFALIGQEKTNDMRVNSISTTSYWIIYFVLLFVSLVIINIRRANRSSNIIDISKFEFETYIKSLDEVVFCPKCGANIKDDADVCHVCKEKIK